MSYKARHVISFAVTRERIRQIEAKALRKLNAIFISHWQPILPSTRVRRIGYQATVNLRVN